LRELPPGADPEGGIRGTACGAARKPRPRFLCKVEVLKVVGVIRRNRIGVHDEVRDAGCERAQNPASARAMILLAAVRRSLAARAAIERQYQKSVEPLQGGRIGRRRAAGERVRSDVHVDPRLVPTRLCRPRIERLDPDLLGIEGRIERRFVAGSRRLQNDSTEHAAEEGRSPSAHRRANTAVHIEENGRVPRAPARSCCLFHPAPA
jgi:hypothetical protein